MSKKSLKDTVKELLAESDNAATLKPKSKSADAPKKLEGEVNDTGEAVVKNDAPKKDYAKNVSKTDEPGPNPPVGAEPMKKLTKEDETEESVTDADEGKVKGETVAEATTEEKEFEFKVDVKEDVDAMLAGTELSEEAKAKVTEIFETALKAQLSKYKSYLDEEFDKTCEAAIDQLAEDMEAKVDDFLGYMAEEWMGANEVAIESNLRTELTEDFISGLRNLFLENFIDIPEDKVSVVEELSGKVDALTAKLDEEIKKNVELNAQVVKEAKKNVLAGLTEGMVATQVEKIKSLAEEVEFTNLEEFKEKISTLIESYYPKAPAKKDDGMLAENAVTEENAESEEDLSEDMKRYVGAVTKTKLI